MVETRSGKMQDPAQERIKAEESAKPQPGATIGRDASSDPVVLNPNIDIPKYDGTEDPRPWIESLEEIGFLYHWADYIISRYAAMNMIGSAKTWLNLHKVSFTSWENFKSRLIEDFASDANKEEMRMRLNRIQQWNEPAIRFAEDILVLCNKVDPQMEEETKINWVIGGLKKEYSFALHLNPPKNTNELLEICKKLDLFEKNYQERAEKSKALYNGPRSPRPHHQEQWKNATSFRRPYQNTSKPQAPAPRYYQNTSKPQAPTPRYYQNKPLPQVSAPRRSYTPNPEPKPVYPSKTYNKNPNSNRNRTEDGRPICFKCNKPGHVARYCRVRFVRIVEEDPIVTQDKVEEEIRMDNGTQKSRPLLYSDLDPKYKMNINVDRIGICEALIDTGADLSVVDLSTALNTGLEIINPDKMCSGPDGKELDIVGNIILNIKFDDKTITHQFVIMRTHLRIFILGRDFLKKMNAKIDCQREIIKYDLTENRDVIKYQQKKIKSAKDAIIPELSIKLINAFVEAEDGEYIIEENHKMFQTNGLRLARSLINVVNKETYIWITNPYPRPLKILKNQTLCFGSQPAEVNLMEESEQKEHEEPQFQINENLAYTEKEQLKQVLKRYEDLFSSGLGRSNLAKHRIDTEGAKPIKHKPYRVSAKEREIIKEQIDEMLRDSIIRPSSSPWSFPVILVKKRDGKYRFCVDYRKLNDVTVKDVYPIPRIDEVLDTLQGSKYFSAIDLKSGYWQVEVEEKDKEKTAFTTAHGLYEFNVMPFGLCNAPATFERNMENMLGNLRWQICLCYLDDVIIYSSDFSTHLKRIEAVLKCFREANLKLNNKKCQFAFEELEILGHITNQHGIKPAEHNIKAIRDFPRPKKIKEVQSFLGMCSYYRKFIKGFSKIADPLTSLIKKNVPFTWTENQEKAFQTLKVALINPPILGHFDPNAITYIHTDASNIGLGATLVQKFGDKEKVISYLSRTLSKPEQNYSTTEKECLAVVWSMSKLRPYLYGRHFKIVTDHHALCWLKNLKDPTGRLARWALKIQEYNFEIIHKSGKKHLDADGLSRGPLPENEWDEDYERLFLNQIIDEKDDFIENIKENLSGNKRSITQNFKEENGCLYKKNPNPEGRAWLLVVPKKRRKEVMSEYHNHMLNGHLGVARTTYRLKNKYYWPSMLKDVSEFVKTCHLCQSRKGSNHLPSGLLQPIPPANYPFERIGIDFVGPLPSTKRRRKWIIVLTDYYTKYAETKAVSEATVKEVSTFLIEHIILRHGAPRFLISDRGSQFTSNLMKEVMKMCKVKHCFTTSYHPQTNGLTERLNRTLINMISMYVNTDQKNWDEILPFITHAYNTTIQETTGYSPFFLLFGREPMSLLDDENIPTDSNMDDYDEYIENYLDKIARTRQVVINNTEKTQERMKRNYDKKHNEKIYEPGHLVAVWTPVRKIGKCEKLLRKYFGPYRILKKLSNVNYLIEPKDNPGQDPLIVHVSRLKPYFERINEVLNETFPNHTFLMNGLIMGIKGFLSFLSAPLIGALSDVWGRKLFLLLTVFFTCAPIPLMKLNTWWYFAMISISGVFAVTFSVVFAYVADVTEESERSAAYGLRWFQNQICYIWEGQPCIGLIDDTWIVSHIVLLQSQGLCHLRSQPSHQPCPRGLPGQALHRPPGHCAGHRSGPAGCLLHPGGCPGVLTGESPAGLMGCPHLLGAGRSFCELMAAAILVLLPTSEEIVPTNGCECRQALRKVGKDSMILMLCITVFLSYLPEAGQYSCFFVYLRLVSGPSIRPSPVCANWSAAGDGLLAGRGGSLHRCGGAALCPGPGPLLTALLTLLMKSIGSKHTIMVGLLFEMLQLMWYGFGSQRWMMWSAGILASVSSISYPAISSFVSTHADADKQGELLPWTLLWMGSFFLRPCCGWVASSLDLVVGLVQGMITGMRGLCNGVGPAVYGFIFYLFHVDLSETSPHLPTYPNHTLHNPNDAQLVPGPPFVFGALLVILALLVAAFIPDSPSRSSPPPQSPNLVAADLFHYEVVPRLPARPDGTQPLMADTEPL
ncbi:hypothetical protein LAZ67_20000122 [Cordylochernes scorpioides]|uniref:RNA-directed DNA polymerase n=1 Tax=Cordylochernes scorpioides TaxID=51811 RepID=A0ABY6LJV0_9ARAC|nr:hypothetical protein LAZ67_20000122 [Cordylochernes scorpioides]